MSQRDIPGLVPEQPEVLENRIDTPFGPVRYYTTMDGKLLTDRRQHDAVLALRVSKLENGQAQMSRQIELNTALTQDIHNILSGTRTLVKLIAFLAPISKWAITVGAAVLFFYALIKGKPSMPSIDLFDN